MAGIGDAASELESVARHLRRAGELELRQSLLKAVSGAVRPVGGEIRASLPVYMPARYAEVLNADLRISTGMSLAGDDPKVSLYGTPRGAKKRQVRRVEAGRLNHPLYGNKSYWFTESLPRVRPGFFSGPAARATPRVRAAILKALDDVARRAVRKGP